MRRPHKYAGNELLGCELALKRGLTNRDSTRNLKCWRATAERLGRADLVERLDKALAWRMEMQEQFRRRNAGQPIVKPANLLEAEK